MVKSLECGSPFGPLDSEADEDEDELERAQKKRREKACEHDVDRRGDKSGYYAPVRTASGDVMGDGVFSSKEGEP